MKELVHLDNFERAQGEWLRKIEGQLDPSTFIDPPTLDSPRSLHACALCGVDPATDLQRLSLRQHFEYVVSGSPWVDRSAPTGFDARDALNACREAGIVDGSIQAKMQAYRNFKHHEAERSNLLLSVQEVRRQFIAEEIFERRRRAHVERSTAQSSASADSSQYISFSKNASSQLPSKAIGNNKAAAAATERPLAHAMKEDAAVVRMDEEGNREELLQNHKKEERESREYRPVERKLLDTPLDDSLGDTSIMREGMTKITLEENNEAAEPNMAVTNFIVEAKSAQIYDETAPPAPPISSQEQGEVFYYYCANAMVSGKVSECYESSPI